MKKEQNYSIDELIEKLNECEVCIYKTQEAGPYNHQRTVIVYDDPSFVIHTNKRLIRQNKKRYYNPGWKRQASLVSILFNPYNGFVANLKDKHPTSLRTMHNHRFLEKSEAKKLFNYLEDLFKEIEKERIL